MAPPDPTSGRPDALAFVLLLTVLSLPFYVLGATVGADLLPGVPVSALMAACPAIAALVLAERRSKGGAVRLLARLTDGALVRPFAWWAAISLLPLAVVLPPGGPEFAALAPASLLLLLALTAGFLLPAAAEELGWTGWLQSALQVQGGWILAGLIGGLARAIWHLIPWAQGGRDAPWIAGQCAFTIAARLILSFLYARAGPSVAAAALFHAAVNGAVFWLPAVGGVYDPWAAAAAATAACVLLPLGRRALTK